MSEADNFKTFSSFFLSLKNIIPKTASDEIVLLGACFFFNQSQVFDLDLEQKLVKTIEKLVIVYKKCLNN